MGLGIIGVGGVVPPVPGFLDVPLAPGSPTGTPLGTVFDGTPDSSLPAATPAIGTHSLPTLAATDSAVGSAIRSLPWIGPPSHLAPWACHGVRALGTPACGGPSSNLARDRTGAIDPLPGQGGVTPPPQAAYDFELAYDAADGYVVLLGVEAITHGTAGAGDMWKFQGGAWQALHPNPLPQNCPGSVLAFDDRDGYLVYFAGPNFAGSYLSCSSGNETWSYRAGTWTQLNPPVSPSPRFGAAMSNDSLDGSVLLFGGLGTPHNSSRPSDYLNDTWEFRAGNWKPISPSTSPSPREEAGLAYDTADGYTLLFGGVNSDASGPPGLSDTWSFSGGSWTQLHPPVSPPGPEPDAFSYDASGGVVVYTTAWNYSGPIQEIVWTFHAGLWTRMTSSAPVERVAAGTAFDYRDGYLIFFGGFGYPANLQDTWSFHGGSWTNRTVSIAVLTVSTFTARPPTDIVGRPLNFTVSATGGVPPYSYAYSGLPPGCDSRNASTLSCSPNSWGRFGVVTTVTDGARQSALATLSLTIAPTELVLGSFGTEPSPVTNGSPVTLAVTLSGGAPPYAFAYAGGPPGCVSQNSSSMTCRPSKVGTFLVTVTVADTWGQFATASTNLTVVVASSAIPTPRGPSELFGLAPATVDALLVGGGSVLVAIGIAIFLRGKRRRRQPPGLAQP
jgi:hypothetical protein